MEKEITNKLINKILDDLQIDERAVDQDAVDYICDKLNEFLNPSDDSKRGQISAVEYKTGWKPIPYKK